MWYNLKCKPGQNKTDYRGKINVQIGFTKKPPKVDLGSLVDDILQDMVNRPAT